MQYAAGVASVLAPNSIVTSFWDDIISKLDVFVKIVDKLASVRS